MLRTLNAAAARRWADLALSALAAERETIDRINVFPVADGDTGTNLLQTMRSAVRTLDEAAPDTLGGVLSALSKGALGGACGNSGMLLSQAIRGLSEQLQDAVTADGAALGEALLRAEGLARQAVAEPQEGTALSVLRGAAAGGQGSDDLVEVVRGATRAAVEALAATPSQLPVLSEAGVVDAGGRGVVLLLDALHAVVCDGEWLAPDLPVPAESDLLEHESSFDYEVMYMLTDTEAPRAEALRERLAELGDCVSVVGDGSGSWAVHVHCDDIGGAVESGIESGRVHRIKVTRFADQQAAYARDVAVLACVPGEALGRLFTAEGADVLVSGSLPVPAELREAFAGTGAAHVVVLPNDLDTALVVERVVTDLPKDSPEVVVVPTASPVQGLAALAVHDPNRRRADDQVAMAEAAAATRRGELYVADAEALTWVGRCRPGDILGLIDGEVVLIGEDLAGTARELLTRMLTTGGELLTALVGDNTPVELPGELSAHLRREHPEVEVVSYPAGALDALLLIGIE
ncbi:DAK2 domain-containing protein [Saccharopolyspora rhizosphaerae]|uniref:DAK2 domain-containing protein n=1 Tax=Saccharopolyspora rhizosphaerae TaxID=2492662 RepID=A0A426JSV2_9PSEU|nr:DAK2 domain-containing protein [Saccharopolyspora rhizosphaerae]RRO16262.1 DAK2 domain-containing protein [Saccharopolyspora rhizosphaerae]